MGGAAIRRTARIRGKRCRKWLVGRGGLRDRPKVCLDILSDMRLLNARSAAYFRLYELNPILSPIARVAIFSILARVAIFRCDIYASGRLFNSIQFFCQTVDNSCNRARFIINSGLGILRVLLLS